MTRGQLPALLLAIFGLSLLAVGEARTQERQPPLRQSELVAFGGDPLSLRDATRDDRWLGSAPSGFAWSPDSSRLYFRYREQPSPDDDPEADPWFEYRLSTTTLRQLAIDEGWKVPSSSVVWSPDRRRAAWVRDGRLVTFDASRPEGRREVVALAVASPLRTISFAADAGSVQLLIGEDLHLFRFDGCPAGREGCAAIQQLTRRTPSEAPPSETALWLQQQQLDLFELARDRKQRDDARDERERAEVDRCVHQLRVDDGLSLDQIERSPNGNWLVVRASRRSPASTTVLSYVNRSGYAEVEQARSKVGEPQTESRLGYVALRSDEGAVCESRVSFEKSADADNSSEDGRADRRTGLLSPSIPAVTWWQDPAEIDRPSTPHAPLWSPDGRRALAQFISADHRDLWITELDFSDGSLRALVHDHDDAWLGGPPIQANYWQPALVEWVDSSSFVFASERTGWSHLYRWIDGRIEALTEGPWEVREATLSRDRTSWLLTTSREHPSDDHLETLPALGGELRQLTSGAGRHNGWQAPDRRHLAILASNSVSQPDLYVAKEPSGTTAEPDLLATATRLTRSGTDAYWRHPLASPEIVAIEHPDGDPVYAALYRPEQQHPLRPAILHIHGGGYRQFSHRGWSVYGFSDHLGLVHHLVQQGYTVLDFDYRGSAGYGRDYRTDIYKAMGHKDVDGAVAAIDWLASNAGVDPERVGLYGISYGGFFTLMAQFRHPGRFAAGVAIASVTDWAHYNHPWTSRVLGLPTDDPEAYRRSSPIEHAEGLTDPLLIVHGLLDENVQFQDVARLSRRLIELEKPFELMVYPAERHVIADEASRLDFARRLTRFFALGLLGEANGSAR